VSRVTLDEIAEDMYKTFKKHNTTYGVTRDCNESVAFWHTIREHFLELRQEILIPRHVPERHYVDYREHLDKKTGLMVGEKLNEEKEVRHKWSEQGFMGEKVNTQVWVLKLPRKSIEELERGE